MQDNAQTFCLQTFLFFTAECRLYKSIFNSKIKTIRLLGNVFLLPTIVSISQVQYGFNRRTESILYKRFLNTRGHGLDAYCGKMNLGSWNSRQVPSVDLFFIINKYNIRYNFFTIVVSARWLKEKLLILLNVVMSIFTKRGQKGLLHYLSPKLLTRFRSNDQYLKNTISKIA